MEEGPVVLDGLGLRKKIASDAKGALERIKDVAAPDALSMTPSELEVQAEREELANTISAIVHAEVEEGLTQQELAERFGMTQYRLRQLRQRHRPLFLEAYQEEAEAFERQAEYARRLIEKRITEEAKALAEELIDLALRAPQGAVRLKAIDLALRTIKPSEGSGRKRGNPDAALNLGKVAEEVKVYMTKFGG